MNKVSRMHKKGPVRDHDRSRASPTIAVEPAFVLLFSVQMKGAFKGFGTSYPGLAPLPADEARAYTSGLSEFESRLLGKMFHEARRITRWPLGRIALGGWRDGWAPDHADVYLLSHTSGVALWEVWIPATAQPFDASRWIDWLDDGTEDGLLSRLWRILGDLNSAITGGSTGWGFYLPLTLLRHPEQPLAPLVKRYGSEIVRLLFLDRSRRTLKSEVVAEELARDYCARQGGMTLLGRRSGFDLRDDEEDDAEVSSPLTVPPRSALPFLITIEILLLEREVLQHLYERLSRHMPRSVDELLSLKQNVLDALEEYYGAITTATRFSDAVTTDGERLLGLNDLYEAVMDRLDAVSFAITTRYQKHMTLLQFWLAIVFGATEIGFIASGIATWHYRAELGAVIAWTVGVSAVSALILWVLLRGKVE